VIPKRLVSVPSVKTAALFIKLMDLNYFAPVAITQTILPHFKKHNKGNMTVIGSIAGLVFRYDRVIPHRNTPLRVFRNATMRIV
jgi:NAD(P)-dependent dehydrogenase (short-subunit alcohol dehydrogenase family)